jgi:hypothetical protein
LAIITTLIGQTKIGGQLVVLLGIRRGLCLPSGTAMTDADLRRVADAVREALE